MEGDLLIGDIDNINAAFMPYSTAVRAYNGANIVSSTIGGTTVFATISAIHVANEKAITDAHLPAPLNEEDTSHVIEYEGQVLKPLIQGAVALTVSKKKVFEQSGQTATVRASLQLLLNDYDVFGSALASKAYEGDEALNEQREATAEYIHNTMQAGVLAFSP
jgi:hypothetical protein